MMNDISGPTSWALGEPDARRIAQELRNLLTASNARSVLLVDRSGHLVASVGEPLDDQEAFASLTAAEFSANSQLARLVGEAEFTSLYHEGRDRSMFVADVAGRAVLAVVFDRQTTLGMVRLRARKAIGDLVEIFVHMFTRVRVGSHAESSVPSVLRGADDEIGRLLS